MKNIRYSAGFTTWSNIFGQDWDGIKYYTLDEASKLTGLSRYKLRKHPNVVLLVGMQGKQIFHMSIRDLKDIQK